MAQTPVYESKREGGAMPNAMCMWALTMAPTAEMIRLAQMANRTRAAIVVLAAAPVLLACIVFNRCIFRSAEMAKDTTEKRRRR